MKTTTEYRIQIDEQQFTVTDPVITGRQLLEKANELSAEEHLIFQLLHDGQLEEIRLDETVDLRQAGIEKFITWRSDRTFYLVIDGRRFPWGAPIITGRQLKKLAGVDPATYSVWLEVRDAADRQIGDTEQVSLETPGVERFFTGKTATTEG